MASEMEKQELIAQFMSITNASDADFARSMLESNGWKLEEAVNLVLGGGGGLNSAGPGPNSGGSSSSSSSSSSGGGVFGGAPGGQDDSQAVKDLMQTLGVDRETAIAIHQAQGGAGGANGGGFGDEDVRAPIARTTGRLMDSGFGGGFGSGGVAANIKFRNFEAESRRLEAQQRLDKIKKEQGGLTSAPIFSDSGAVPFGQVNTTTHHDDDDEDVDYYYEDDNDDENGGQDDMDYSYSSKNGKSKQSSSSGGGGDKIQQLFAPPRELLFQGTFEQAMEQAKTSRRWLLVNVQKDSEFFSYVLNRDLWSSDLIADIVRSSFIFFQREDSDSEARRYDRYYKISKFPHIAIIDPRTREQSLILDLKTRANENDPNDLRSSFLDKVSAFLEKNSLASGGGSSRNLSTSSLPTPPPPAPPPSSSSGSTFASTPTLPVSAPMDTSDSSEKTISGGKRLASPKEGLLTSAASGGKIEYDPLEDEPAADVEGKAQIRFRLFSGKTVTRSFLETQKVGQLFSFVHSLEPETGTRSFDLVIAGIPPTSLRDLQDQTLQEANLQRASITAKWL